MQRTRLSSLEASANLTEALSASQVGRMALHAAEQAYRESLAVFASRLEENKGRLANLVARPIQARLLMGEGEKKHWTTVSCYSLFDEVREPRQIEHYVLGSVQTTDREPRLLVTAPDGESGYDIRLGDIHSIQILEQYNVPEKTCFITGTNI